MVPFKHTSQSLQRFGSQLFNGRVDDRVKMPGKSNKFDLTNRPNSGTKLGEIIGNTFQKEAEKVRKDAERQAAKARKQSSSSSSGFYDTASSVHIIDLKAPSKDLGDDGVCAMVDGMKKALKNEPEMLNEPSIASLALEDLNLASNGITTIALAALAPVITLAKYDLKTINLSCNNIEVLNDEQAEQWETFLLAFANCRKLRRLDLSGNERLGSRALEIFARVHVKEPQVTPVPPGGNTSVLSLVSENGENDADADAGEIASLADLDDAEDKLNVPGFLSRRCGLRSIPYITLQNIGLVDAGALWLSYVVEDHYYPSQLITELNATNAESVIKAYQQNTHKKGIDWTENKQLGREGAQLLDRTELIREHRLHTDLDALADELDLDESSNDGADGRLSLRAPADKTSLRAKPGHRRASIRSIRTMDGGEHEISELESMRKKIMRHIIRHDGVNSVEIWQSSIAVFRASRMLRWFAPTLQTHDNGELLFSVQVPATPTVQPPTPISSPTQENGEGLKIDTELAKAASKSHRESYASKLQARSPGSSSKPDSVITEVTNTPTTPLRLQRPTHRKGAFSAGNEIEHVSSKLDALVVRESSTERFIKFQQGRIERKTAEGVVFRDLNTPSHLPMEVVDRLMSFMVHPKYNQVCINEQRRRAIERGLDKATMTAEREWLKKDMSAQVLMLLDGLKCLHYGQ